MEPPALLHSLILRLFPFPPLAYTLAMQPTLQVPVLETERLLLRGHCLDDFPHSAAMWADPAVTRYIREKPFTREETWSRFLRYLGHWALLGYGYWLIVEKSTGSFAGEIGFADYHRDIEPSLDGMPECGWALTAQMHGKGYATEALRAILAWGDHHFRGTRTACIIAPENRASLQLAAKCGYREMENTSYHDHPVTIFARDPQ